MNLSHDQIISNIANVIYIAKIDGKITASESKTIDDIVKRYGAKKSDFNKANKISDSKDFVINLSGNYSDKIKNLEELIHVALIDGELDENEKSKFLEAARSILITNNQLDIIISDVNSFIESNNSTKKCQNCNSDVANEAKFCPECGSPISELQKEPSIMLSYEIPSDGLSIEFAESTSASFADAVIEQQKAPINKTCQKAKKTWYLASWPNENVIASLNLASNLKGLRNRKIYLNGEEQKWDEVFGFTYCAEQRNSAYNPIKYCFGLDENRFNIWGCTQARMDWSEWANWFSYGDFEKKGLLKNQITFKFNKDKISHELKNNLNRCKYCPHIKFDFIEKVLEKFPSEVTVNDKNGWTYKRDYNESPGAIKVVTKSGEGSFTFRDEFFSSGVAPKSLSLGLEIIRDIIKETQNFNELEQIVEG